jgi:hypothetical protein
MRLTKVSVDSFLQIKGLDLVMEDKPVHLIAGLNESGKSSLHEAIRFAYLGETARVSLKRDYKMMIRDGSQVGGVRIEYVDDEGNHDFVQRDVGTGKVTDGYDGDPEFAIAQVMDATKMPLLKPTDQRDFLLQFLGVKVDRDDVASRLRRRGVTDEYIEKVMPLLRAGFQAAHTEAKSHQSKARAMWEQLTGEKWGSQKGGEWKPEKRLVVKPAIESKQKEADTQRKAYETAAQEVGRQYKGGFMGPCPKCGEKLCFTGQDLVIHAELPQNRDEMDEVSKAEQKRDQLRELWNQTQAEVDQMKADVEFNDRLDEIQEESQVLHQSVLSWMQLADLLSPTGIPGEILADAMKPLNDRLRNTAVVTGWDQVSITPQMEIMIGSRPYGLGSESAQWRAQAAIAEAISYVGEIGMLCLDRIDVLDMPNRNRLLKWVQSVSDDHATILLFGTLKEPPKKLPPAFQLHWLDHGSFVE